VGSGRSSSKVASPGEHLVAAGDQAGVVLLHLHRGLHGQADHPDRQGDQRLRQLAGVVDDGGGQTDGGADGLGDLTRHGPTLPRNGATDTQVPAQNTRMVVRVSSLDGDPSMVMV
jgi:hypothetical protein